MSSSSAGLFTTVVFNPALLSKEDLVRGFVARQDLLDRLLDDLRRVQPDSPPQHQLLIGQRGLGKTTLLRRLAFAIEDDPQLSAIWLPLVFPEEQYNVKRLSDFWLNCVDALSDALDRAGDKAAADALDRKVESVPSDAERRSAAALSVLIEEAQRLGRKLVLLVDNVDVVLDRIDEKEEWEFRRVISSEHRIYLIGASSRALETLYEHGRAFYDYFQPHDLKGLTEGEMFSVLDKLAGEAGDERVKQIIRANPARLRALRVLTGGNPRTLALLYRILAQGPDGDVQRDIEQLLDLYTPLYKARFEEMAPQAQQVIDAMAIHWDPVTAAELTEALQPLQVNQVSALLKRLEDFAVVEKTPWFGESKAAYQISERFFNIWYLMRASRRVRRRLIWLVRFLEAWFEREELVEHARKYLQRDPTAVGAGRYAETTLAYSQLVDDRRLRRSLEFAGLRAALDVSVRDQFDFSDLPPELQDRKERMERLRDLRSRVLAMRFEGIEVEELWRLLGGSPHLTLAEKTKVVDELPGLGLAGVQRLFATLMSAKRRLDGAFPRNTEDVAVLYDALRHGVIGDVYDVEGLLEVAERRTLPSFPIISVASRTDPFCMPDKLSANELKAAESTWRTLISEPACATRAICGFGNLLRDRTKQYDKAEKLYRHAIEIDPTSPYPWGGLGLLLQRKLQRPEEAEQAFRQAIQFDPTSAWAWDRLARLLAGKPARYEEAEQAFRRAIELDPKLAYPWDDLGVLLTKHLQRYEEAEQAFRRSIELDPKLAYPWNDLGVLLMDHLQRYEEAEQAYRQAIKLDAKYANPWNGLGNLLANHLQRYEEAEQAYRRAIELDPKYARPWNGLGNLLADHLHRYEEAEQAYRQAIELDAKYANPWNGLGILFTDHLQRNEEAEQAYRRAIELDPKSPYPWGNLALLIEKDGVRQEEALEAYVKAAEFDPTNSSRRRLALDLARTLGTKSQESISAARKSVSHLREVFPEDEKVAFVLVGLLVLDAAWQQAERLLTELASREIGDPDLWTFKAILNSGHLDDLIELLHQTDASDRWRPLYVALRAIEAGGRQYLRRVAPEVRVIAERILTQLAPELPDRTASHKLVERQL